MMRPIHIPIMAMAMLLLPYAGYADDYQDCRSTCAAEKESRNMNCPSPYDSSASGQDRSQCMKDNQAAYEDCVNHCPTPPTPPSSETQPSPPPMAY